MVDERFGFPAPTQLNKPDCREELPIFHRKSYQKAGLKWPKAQNQSFPNVLKGFYLLQITVSISLLL
ncbi:hypothetical protein QF042_001179 [Pedobacter sp. W3I1]|nr:hypothetical protein [Pedobacter sp. W3I1]